MPIFLVDTSAKNGGRKLMSKAPEGATHYRRCSRDCCSTYFRVTPNYIYYWTSSVSMWRVSQRTLDFMKPIKKSLAVKLMEAF